MYEQNIIDGISERMGPIGAQIFRLDESAPRCSRDLQSFSQSLHLIRKVTRIFASHAQRGEGDEEMSDQQVRNRKIDQLFFEQREENEREINEGLRPLVRYLETSAENPLPVLERPVLAANMLSVIEYLQDQGLVIADDVTAKVRATVRSADGKNL